MSSCLKSALIAFIALIISFINVIAYANSGNSAKGKGHNVVHGAGHGNKNVNSSK
jgi:hypothetical protein